MITKEIEESLLHLSALNENPFELQTVARWLYEYHDLYREILSHSENLCEECQELKDQNLPFDCIQNPDHCTKKYNYFIEFYKGVEYGVNIQELDAVCKTALQEYESCSNDAHLKDWLIKYFDIGYNKLIIFQYDHLDYEVSKGEVKHPHFGNSPIGEFGVCINRKYYENLIRFEEVFKMLFYEKRLYPEKLKEMEEEMSKIVLPMIPIPKIKQ